MAKVQRLPHFQGARVSNTVSSFMSVWGLVASTFKETWNLSVRRQITLSDPSREGPDQFFGTWVKLG